MKETDESEEDATRPRNLSSQAAGVVRGVSRSIGKSVAKSVAKSSKNMSKSLPKQVPKIAKDLFTRRGRLRVRQVAKVSDRLSTGWDVYSSAMESVEGETKVQKKTRSWAPVLTSLRTFAFSEFLGAFCKKMILDDRLTLFFLALLRNSIAGAIVFETYVFTISKVAPGDSDAGMHHDESTANNDLLFNHVGGDLDDAYNEEDTDEEEEDTDEMIHWDVPDEFARASLFAHVGAGALAGSLDGFMSSAWESKSQFSPVQFFRQKAPLLVLQQSVSHAILFGSYELCKRNLVHRMHLFQYGDRRIQDSGLWHLGCIAIAGGVAGQLQFLTSHYGEQMQETQHFLGNQISRNQILQFLRQFKHPNIGSMLGAFVPSAVGFIAFEYGKQLGT